VNAILKAVCALPTAPFREPAVSEYIRRLCTRHDLPLKEDRYGNLLVGNTRPSAGRWVLVAHTDHPGFEAAGMVRNGVVRAGFRGYVLATHMRGVGVVFFDGAREIRGRVIRALADERGVAMEVHVRVDAPASTGSPGMFDFAVAHQKGRALHSRALDDLAGVAAALQAVINARRRNRRANVAALLTRAEEVGFIGAIAAARDRRLIKSTDRIISIECSAMQPYAPQGKGAIIRVGDRTSVFDSGLTYLLTQTAQNLAAKRKNFTYQRALMPGGTCEATAFDVYGYRAAAVCVPLGNYHNMVPNRKALGPEYIDLQDWESLVSLLTDVSAMRDDGRSVLRTRLDAQFKKHQRLLDMQ
jgi:endoglucanase